MRGFRYVALTAVAGLSFLSASSKPVEAQVNINIGVAPNCPYGYYETAPYGSRLTDITALNGLLAVPL